MNTTRTRCTATNTYAGGRAARCRSQATGDDGLCTRHRNFFKPRPAPCRACWAADPPRGTTCAEHADQAGTFKSAGR